jgi:hypothetical protein
MANDFPINIPAYTDTADIQKAFLRYHYGIDTIPDENYEIVDTSVSGYLRDTLTALQQAQSELSVVPKLTSVQNLNDIIDNGNYLATDNPTTGSSTVAPIGLNYPSTTRGVLRVVSDTNDILTFQTYQTIQATNDFWWRTATQTLGTRIWSPWVRSSKDGHTHEQYATNDQLSNKIDSSISASKAVATDSAGKIVSLDVTATELGYLKEVTSSVQSQLGDKAPLSHNHNDLYFTKTEQPKIFVQSTSPGTGTGVKTGDLWFW